MQWVPKGTLGDLLVKNSALSLNWTDPLLRLATDVARGGAYLHAREYFDEQDGTRKRCIIHRDLKVRRGSRTEPCPSPCLSYKKNKNCVGAVFDRAA